MANFHGYVGQDGVAAAPVIRKIEPRDIDEALAKSGEAAGNSAKVVDLAQKRSELETALQAAEETWLALSSQAEAAE